MCSIQQLTFDELLSKSNSITIHTKNLQLLVGEVFKSLNRLSPEITWDTFTPKQSRYNLRQGSSLIVPRARTTRAINSLDFRAALAWNYLPKHVKEEKSLYKFNGDINGLNIYCRCFNCQQFFLYFLIILYIWLDLISRCTILVTNIK